MKVNYKALFIGLFLWSVLGFQAQAQTGKTQQKNFIYIDKKGIIRYSSNHQKAYFFGVNYTVPFAYGYRSHKALGINLEKAIDEDVYHLSRMGINAFRLHVWDTEITDSVGNLLQNEHLRLFDYLLNQLEKRHIKILFTPLAFWGNGYPEKDEQTAGFSGIYSRTEGPELVAGEKTDQVSFKISTQNLGDKQSIGWQLFVADKLRGRLAELPAFTKIVVCARTTSTQPVKIRISLIDAGAFSNASFITLDQQFRNIEIPLNKFSPDSSLLLPRPYPGFLPLWFKAAAGKFKLDQLDKLEVIGTGPSATGQNQPYSFEIESILLKKD